jgi:hypothetical protein
MALVGDVGELAEILWRLTPTESTTGLSNSARASHIERNWRMCSPALAATWQAGTSAICSRPGRSNFSWQRRGSGPVLARSLQIPKLTSRVDTAHCRCSA